MKRKTLLTLSITGILLVIIAVVGYTYGYYTMKINENTEEKSIEIVTGESKLLYTDLSSEVNKIIEVGYTNIKLFTVENIGDDEVYYSIYLSDVENDFVRTQDITYTLYRNAGDNSIDINNLSNYDIVSKGYFPKNDSHIKLNEYLENINDIYTYALKIEYENSSENQNIDKGHIFAGTVSIKGEVNTSLQNNTLAKTIFDNALNNTNPERTTYYDMPLTNPAEEVSLDTEKVLSVAQDDYGNSYYFRGNVIDNYVNFAGMCWRIVRVLGNGSVKLIIDDSSHTCNSDYTGDWGIGQQVIFGHNGSSEESQGYARFADSSVNGLAYELKKYQNEVLSSKISTTYSKSITDMLEINDICFDNTVSVDSSNNYMASNRLTVNYKPTLKCSETLIKKFNDNSNIYVGTLTADENAFAGLKDGTSNNNVYLVNGNSTYREWWTTTLKNKETAYDNIYSVFNGRLGILASYKQYIMADIYDGITYARPTIVLKSSISATGNGTKTSPYIVG